MSKKTMMLAAVCAALCSGIAWAHQDSSDVYATGAMHARMFDPYTNGMDNTDVRGPCGGGDGK